MLNEISNNLICNTVSVIIPVFNVHQYIVDALESVISQTYRNLEIIIIDDGSTDGSADICDKFAKKDTRITVVHQDNKGLSGARNTGLDLITGDAVTFLDADDVLCPNYIMTMISIMNQEKTDLVICDYIKFNDLQEGMKRVVNRSHKPHVSVEPGKYDRIGALRALADGAVSHHVWNKLYRSELWNSVRFPEGHVYEDVDTTFRIIDLCNSVYFYDETLYLYRMRSGSIINTQSKENIKDCISACNSFELFIYDNIPYIFSLEHLQKAIITKLKCMIVYYALFSGEVGQEEKEYCSQIRRDIITAVKEIGVYNCDNLVKVSYWLILKNPRFFRMAYHPYHVLRQHIKRR